MHAASPHTQLECVSAPGGGAALGVTVTVGGQSAAGPAAVTLSYLAPVLTALTGPGTALVDTSGGVTIFLAGDNFGPTDDGTGRFVPRANFSRGGRTLSASSCQVVFPHTQMSCVIGPGTGAGYAWTALVGGQPSAACAGCPLTSYRPPVVASFTGAGAQCALTPGQQGIQVLGSGFWPLTTP